MFRNPAADVLPPLAPVREEVEASKPAVESKAAEELPHPNPAGTDTTPRAAGSCAVCFDEDEVLATLCGPQCAGGVCSGCARQAFTMAVDDSYPGVLKKMPCPCCGPARMVPAQAWHPLVSGETRATWAQRAAQLLSFQCPACHTRKTLLPTGSAEEERAARVAWEAALAGKGEAGAALAGALDEYQRGELLQSAVVPFMDAAFPEDRELPVKDLALAIPDLERRAALLSAWWYKHPRIRTLCCNREACKRCVTRDVHEGRSCTDYSAELFSVSEIIHCQACGIAIVRGDGCNSASCPCGGFAFSWSTELGRKLVVALLGEHGGDLLAAALQVAAWVSEGEGEHGETCNAFRNVHHNVLATAERVRNVRGGDVAAAMAEAAEQYGQVHETWMVGAVELWGAEMFAARAADPEGAAAQTLADGGSEQLCTRWMQAQPDDVAARVRAAARAETAGRWVVDQGAEGAADRAARHFLGLLRPGELSERDVGRVEAYAAEFPAVLSAATLAVLRERVEVTEAALAGALARDDLDRAELAALEAADAADLCEHDAVASACEACALMMFSGSGQSQAQQEDDVALGECMLLWEERTVAQEVMALRAELVSARARVEGFSG